MSKEIFVVVWEHYSNYRIDNYDLLNYSREYSDAKEFLHNVVMSDVREEGEHDDDLNEYVDSHFNEFNDRWSDGKHNVYVIYSVESF